MSGRVVNVERATKETRIAAQLALDGTGVVRVKTGIGFLDHMIAAMASHARFDLTMEATGDLEVDDHHTAEDCAIVIGQALDRALGDRAGIERFGWCVIPMDEALAQVAVDLVTRPVGVVELGLKREMLGGLSTENIPHFFGTLATSGRFTLHVSVLRGENDHHRAESAFKAVGVALRQATRGGASVSTKGVM